MKPLPYVVGLERCPPLLCTPNSPPTPASVDALKALIKFGEIHIFAVTLLCVTDGLEREGLLPASGEEGGPCPRWVPTGTGVQMLAVVFSPACARTLGNPKEVEKEKDPRLSWWQSGSCREAAFSSIVRKSRNLHGK